MDMTTERNIENMVTIESEPLKTMEQEIIERLDILKSDLDIINGIVIDEDNYDRDALIAADKISDLLKFAKSLETALRERVVERHQDKLRFDGPQTAYLSLPGGKVKFKQSVKREWNQEGLKNMLEENPNLSSIISTTYKCTLSAIKGVRAEDPDMADELDACYIKTPGKITAELA